MMPPLPPQALRLLQLLLPAWRRRHVRPAVYQPLPRPLLRPPQPLQRLLRPSPGKPAGCLSSLLSVKHICRHLRAIHTTAFCVSWMRLQQGNLLAS